MISLLDILKQKFLELPKDQREFDLMQSEAKIEEYYTLKRTNKSFCNYKEEYEIIRLSPQSRRIGALDEQCNDPVYTVFADSWSRKFGGINSFNYDFCLALALYLWDRGKVQVVVPESDYTAIRDAQRGWGLAFCVLPEATNENYCASVREQIKNIPPSKFVIGHDIVTGPIAQEVAQSWGAKFVYFTHMDYEKYAFLKDNEPAKKIDLQKRLRANCSLNVAVGPLLQQSVQDTLATKSRTDSVFKFVPGRWMEAWKSEYIPPNHFTVMYVGRSNEEVDRVKLAPAVVVAYAQLCESNEIKAKESSIKIVGTSDVSRLKTLAAAHLHGGVIELHGVPYTKSHRELIELYGSASVVFMPSYHEGYGLVAVEAISRGVPIFVSKNSGVHKEIEQRHCLQITELDDISLDISGTWDDSPNPKDVEQIKNALRRFVTDPTYYRGIADKLRALEWDWVASCANLHETVIHGTL